MTRAGRRRLYLFGAALLVIALVGGRWLSVETAERAWNRTFAGGEALIEARTLGRLLQGLVFTFAIVWTTGNLLIVYRAIGSVQMPRRLGDLEIVEAVPQRMLLAITVALGVVLGALLSLGAGDWWRHAVLASAPPRFGLMDGGRDLGYYIGVLPWHAVLQNRALVLVTAVTGAVALLYALIGSVRIRRGRIRASDHARAHCGVLLAALALVIAWGAVLDPAEVLAGLHGPADQAALAVRVPGAAFVAAVAFVTAIISLLWGWRDRPNLILAGWAALILALMAGYAVIPGVVRASGNATPARLASRRAVLERVAFDLLAPDPRLPPPFESAEATVRRMPVWDASRVGAAVGAAPGAVTLRADAQPSWLVASTAAPAVARILTETDTGLAQRRVALADSGLLFGPGLEGFVLAPPDSAPRLRAASIPVVGPWRRFALAWTIQAWELLRGEAQGRLLLWRRDVTERLERLAPFARFGAPAPAIRDGALWWVSWGYVSSEAFPLARPLVWRDSEIRYLRAGLVGAVSVATGETHLWLAPGYDSLTAAWARQFSPLIEPASMLPADIRAQLAFPADAFQTAVLQLIRYSSDSVGPNAVWMQRPRSAFELAAPDARLWTGVAVESGTLTPKVFEGLIAGTVTPQGPRVHWWRPPPTAGQATRLPGELIGSYLVRPGQFRIWAAGGGGDAIVTVQAQFLEPAGVTPPPPPRVAEVYVSVGDKSGRGLNPLAALAGGEEVVTDTSLAARWLRARRLAAQADSALGAGDLERFGRLWRALMRELAPAPRPR